MRGSMWYLSKSDLLLLMWFHLCCKNKDPKTQKPQPCSTNTGEQPDKQPVSHSEPSFSLGLTWQKFQEHLPESHGMTDFSASFLIGQVHVLELWRRSCLPYHPAINKAKGSKPNASLWGLWTNTQMGANGERGRKRCLKQRTQDALAEVSLSIPGSVQEEWWSVGRVAEGRLSNFEWEAWLHKSHRFEMTLTLIGLDSNPASLCVFSSQSPLTRRITIPSSKVLSIGQKDQE